MPGPHRGLRAAGAATAAALAGIHLARLVPTTRAAAYLGVLFAAVAACLAWVALRLLRSDGSDGWLAAVALAAGLALGYVLSCTVGLPGLPTDHWSALGDTSVGLDCMLLALAVGRARAILLEGRNRETLSVRSWELARTRANSSVSETAPVPGRWRQRA